MSLRTKLLQLLKHSSPDYISGERICRQLGVSRTAIWKQVEALRSMEYEIEARPNAGYRLVSVPDRLYPEEVTVDLGTNLVGCEIRYESSLESTNESAKQWAREGAPDGGVFLAEEQGMGKGRMGRGWFSPRGKGLWFSVVLRPRVDMAGVPQVTLVAAVSVAGAIFKETGLAPGIKWPNDILTAGGKLCGILTEMNADMDRVNDVVLGVGLNVNILPGDIPRELQGVVNSLAIELGHRVNRVKLLQAILRELDQWYQLWCAGGFEPVLKEWKKWNVTLGRKVHVKTFKEVVEGLAVDLDGTGALLVRLDNGNLKRFVAGEVSLRPGL